MPLQCVSLCYITLFLGGLIKGARLVYHRSKPHYRLYEKRGGHKEAIRDFQSLMPRNIKTSNKHGEVRSYSV